MSLNCVIHWHADFFSIVSTTVLHDPRLIEPADSEPRLWRKLWYKGLTKLHVDFRLRGGSVPLIPTHCSRVNCTRFAVGKRRPRRLSDIVPVWGRGPENQEKWWCKFHSESEFQGRGRLMSQLTDSQTERENSLFLSLLFYTGLQRAGWYPLTPGRMSCFIQSTDSDVSSI